MMTQPTIDPLWGYWVISNGTLTQLDYQVLIDLYQPIIGSDALSLYQLLWQHQVPLVSQRKAHSQLLNLLDLDIQHFYQARIKLEAVALLQTFQSKDSWGDYLIYQLQLPLAGANFFQDSILTTYLQEKIGQPDFQQLFKKYHPQLRNLDQAKEITKSFLEVFHLSHKVVDAKVEASAQQSTVNQPNYRPTELATFDWDFLKTTVRAYHVAPQQIDQNQSELFNLHTFYGLSEVELAQAIGQTLNVQTDQIDLRRLKALIQKQYEQRVNLKTAALPSAAQTPPVTNLSANQRKLIKAAQNQAPAEFLANKKHQKNGFVGSSETNILRKLQARMVLPEEVVNILVNYVLDNSPTLTQGFVEKIANDWVQHGIKTAPQAIKYLQAFPQKQTRKKRSATNKKESGTDWSKTPSQQVNSEQLAQMQRQLRQLKDHSE